MGFFFPLAKRGYEIGSPLPPAPPIAASLRLIRLPKLIKIYRTGAAHVMGFFSTGQQRLWNRKSPAPRPPPPPLQLRWSFQQYCIVGSNKLCTGATIGPNFFRFFLFLYSFLIFYFCYSLLILLSFLNFFLFIYSYSCLLISSYGSYCSYSSRTILCLLIFLFLYFNLFLVLQTHKLCTSETIHPYFCVLSLFIVFWTFVFVILFLFFSLKKTPRKIQLGKKSAKVYHSLYSSTGQLQVALWTYMFLKFG